MKKTYRFPTVSVRVCSRAALIRLGILTLCLVVAGLWCFMTMIRMPGISHRGPVPPATANEIMVAEELRGHVTTLANDIGPRNVCYASGLAQAAEYLEGELANSGLRCQRQTFEVSSIPCHNLWVEVTGADYPDEFIVVGAHYDTCLDSPGANDNASGVAAVLSLARRLSGAHLDRSVRLVLFVNEEPPYFQTEQMGSVHYAKWCRERGDRLVAMLSLETIGYYSEAEGSQSYPPPLGALYPSQGDFIGFVGEYGSARLVRDCVLGFRNRIALPSEGAALPRFIPGVGWSDHWSFAREGYPALMVTDTAPFRYPHYHQISDTPDRLDYRRMARVVFGVEALIKGLAERSDRGKTVTMCEAEIRGFGQLVPVGQAL